VNLVLRGAADEHALAAEVAQSSLAAAGAGTGADEAVGGIDAAYGAAEWVAIDDTTGVRVSCHRVVPKGAVDDVAAVGHDGDDGPQVVFWGASNEGIGGANGAAHAGGRIPPDDGTSVGDESVIKVGNGYHEVPVGEDMKGAAPHIIRGSLDAFFAICPGDSTCFSRQTIVPGGGADEVVAVAEDLNGVADLV